MTKRVLIAEDCAEIRLYEKGSGKAPAPPLPTELDAIVDAGLLTR
ncbi:MAG: hypothetical protein QOF33_4973 [Thermomicrobiales bacterium]|jgi:hypothetical protein|nr:hypothetical protein [Thermomicrobiales bacterium]